MDNICHVVAEEGPDVARDPIKVNGLTISNHDILLGSCERDLFSLNHVEDHLEFLIALLAVIFDSLAPHLIVCDLAIERPKLARDLLLGEGPLL